MDAQLTEQAIAETVGAALQGVFWYPGSLGYWFVSHEGAWTPSDSPALLWTAIVAGLRSLSPEEETTVKRGRRGFKIDSLLSGRGWSEMRQLLEADPRLRVSAEAFDAEPHQLNLAGGWLDLITREKHPPGPVPMFFRRANCGDLDWLDSLVFAGELSRQVSGDAQAVIAFIRAALSRERAGKRVLYVDSRLAPDLSPLFPLLSSLLGDYVCRLPWPVWSRWPISLDIPLWMRLTGVRILFLDPAPNGRFQAELLDRIVRSESEEMTGLDGAAYRLTVPSHFVLCGQVTFLQPWQQELLGLLQTVSGPRGGRP